MRRKCNERTATQLRSGQRIQAARCRRVADAHLRKSFRGAMDFLIGKRAAQFPDLKLLERQRSLAEHIRKYSLARLPELLEQLERKLTENGVQVHWAENPKRRTRIIIDIARAIRRG
jgi:L-lactate dehydrogenase complex protein LldF